MRKGEVGIQLGITVVDATGTAVDISTATSLTMLFEKPDGSRASKVGVQTSGGADGKVHYASVADFPDAVGRWSRQAKIVFASGTTYITGRVEFDVERPI